MTTFNSILKYIWNSSIKEKIFIVRICLLYSKVMIFVKFLPLKFYYHKFFSEYDLQEGSIYSYRRELNNIKKISRFLPWKVTCLMESMVIHSYLKRENIYLPIKLGVSLNGQMKAHAWCINNTLQNYTQIKISYDE